MKLSEAKLDAKTLKYIEYIAQAKGQKALDKYLKWTGWYEVGHGMNSKGALKTPMRRQKSVESRLAKAARRAETWRLL